MSDDDRKKKYRKILLGVVGSVLVATIASVALGYTLGTNTDHHKHHDKDDEENTTESNVLRSLPNWEAPKIPDNFLVKSKECEIPRVEPSALRDKKNIVKFERNPTMQCDSYRPLTNTQTEDDLNSPLELTIDKDVINQYPINNISELSCCYKVITRKNEDENIVPDDCTKFEDNFTFADAQKATYLYTECLTLNELVYNNIHGSVVRVPIAGRRALTRKYYKRDEDAPFSVLIWAISGPSRMSLERSWKETKKVIEGDKNWIEMKGFVKMGSKFDMIYTMLTGRSPDEKYGNCDPKSGGFLDECDWIWNDFKKAGYHTAYGEDQVKFNTFNVNHKGFKDPPTHSYFRPTAIAIETLLDGERIYNGKIVCTPLKYYLQYLNGFIEKLQAFDQVFGVVVSNSYSELLLSSAVTGDYVLSKTLQKSMRSWRNRGQMIGIFMSDAGLRYEKGEKGFYEERLPFLYIWLPDEFKKAHPHLDRQLRSNVNKLFSTYDIYIFLRELLKLQAPATKLIAPSCDTCKSIAAKDMPMDRSCQDAKIPDETCACNKEALNTRRIILDIPRKNDQDDEEVKVKCNEKIKLFRVKDVKAVPLDKYENSTFQVKFRTSNSGDLHEVVVRKKPFKLFSDKSYEVMAKTNFNETICKKQREILMKKLLRKIFNDYSDEDYEDLTFGDE